MSGANAERNKVLIRRVFEEGVSRGDWAVIDEAFSQHNMNYPGPEPLSAERIKQGLQERRILMPDLRAEILRMVAEGETVMTIERWSGTVKATGQYLEGTVFHLFRFEDGQVVEEWSEGWSWLDPLRESEPTRSAEEPTSPLFTTRTWIFKPEHGDQGQEALRALDRVAEQIPGATVRLFQDRDQPERFVTLGAWPDRDAFNAFSSHPEIRPVRDTFGHILAETFPSDQPIFLREISGTE